MALITCKDCEKEISSSATACPSCGCPKSELPSLPVVGGKYTTCKSCNHGYSNGEKTCPNCGKRPTAFGTKVILGLVIFSALVAILGGIGENNRTPEPASQRTEAGIRVLGDEMLITNKSEFTWPSVEFFADKILWGYSYNYPNSVAPGDSITISQSDFTRESSRFDPRTMAMTKLIVHVPGHDAPNYVFK